MFCLSNIRTMKAMRIVNPVAVLGEEMACEYLKKQGYQILERNFRKSYGEIDIIARKGDVVVFVEVKTRTNNSFGTPFDAIAPHKLQQIIKGAKYYVYILHPDLPDNLRIDAIGVIVKDGRVISLEHRENVSGF